MATTMNAVLQITSAARMRSAVARIRFRTREPKLSFLEKEEGADGFRFWLPSSFTTAPPSDHGQARSLRPRRCRGGSGSWTGGAGRRPSANRGGAAVGILAIARGAGEVAPLMLVGAVKLAPELPIDGSFPYIHPERSFMHLGFHIYDLGFQSQNSEAAKPMVFTTTLLLILIVVLLNIAAIWIRARLRRRFVA